MNGFLTTPEAAQFARVHPRTLADAAREGVLHGYQPLRKGIWKFEEDCVAAWVRGERCRHR